VLSGSTAPLLRASRDSLGLASAYGYLGSNGDCPWEERRTSP
jgi:hypothetical protein